MTLVWIVGVIAAIAGILIGFLAREARRRRSAEQELARDLSANKSDLGAAQAESTAVPALKLWPRAREDDRSCVRTAGKAERAKLAARVKDLRPNSETSAESG